MNYVFISSYNLFKNMTNVYDTIAFCNIIVDQ